MLKDFDVNNMNELNDYSKENILASIEEFEKKIKKPSYKCFIEHWGLLRRRYIKNEKYRFYRYQFNRCIH